MTIENGIKLLIHAYPGSGKTRFLKTVLDVPEFNPTLLIDFDGGLRTIQSYVEVIPKMEFLRMDKTAFKKDKLTTVSITSALDLDAIFDYIFNRDHPFNTIAVDSLTEINRLAMDTALKINELSEVKVTDVKVPEWPEYKKSHAIMVRFLRTLRNSKFNVICTAQSKSDKKAGLGGDSVVTRIYPALIGQLSQESEAIFDFVGAIELGAPPKYERRLLLGPHNIYATKARVDSDKPVEAISPVTLTKLIEVINNV